MSPSNPPSDKQQINFDLWAQTAAWLEAQAVGLCIEKIVFLDIWRLVIIWSQGGLLIDLHPQFANALFLETPIQENKWRRTLHIDTTDIRIAPHVGEEVWKKRLEGARLNRSWVSVDGSLHLSLLSKSGPSQLTVRLQARRPNLYWMAQGEIVSLFNSTYKPDQNHPLLVPSAPRPATQELERLWLEREDQLQKKYQSELIQKHYDERIVQTTKKIAKLEKSLKEMADPAKLQHEGLLLQTYRYLYQEGMHQLIVNDWVSGNDYCLQLNDDPLQKQIRGRFHQAKGLQAHQKQVNVQLNALKTQLMEIRKNLRRDLARGFMDSLTTPAIKLVAQVSKPYRGFFYEGARIYIGKTSRDNLFVTFQIAHGNDLWMHVSDYPGSHVVVKAPEITAKIMKAAALLAHHYSQARKKPSIEVTYTEAKWVKKLPGVKTGTVGLQQSQTYLSTYDEPLLQELLTYRDPTL